MKILVTGATGLVGKHLLPRLIEIGHDVRVLSRDPVRAARDLALPCETYAWNPQTQDLTQALAPALEGVEAVIHLAGESVGIGRWTPEHKKKILESRTVSTRNLIHHLSKIPTLKTFICASAIGIYGNRGDELLSESSLPSTTPSTGADSGFLAEVCRQWETEGNQLQDRVRTVLLRTGVVLSDEGGALEQIIRPFRIGLGGPIGSGRQWISWIHLNDLVRVILYALQTPDIRGPINAVSPMPVQQITFARFLGKVLSRPAVISTPQWAVRAALGEKADLVLISQRVIPQALIQSGFEFKYGDLKTALQDLIGYQRNPGTHLIHFHQWIPKPVEEVFSFFSDEKNLEAITPPWLNFHVLGKSTPEVAQKTEIDYRLKIHGVPVHWRSRIVNWEKNQAFTDIQIKGPYSRWEHFHRFIPMKGGTYIEDRIIYQTPGGAALEPVIGQWVKRDVQKIFSYRRKKITEVFAPREANS